MTSIIVIGITLYLVIFFTVFYEEDPPYVEVNPEIVLQPIKELEPTPIPTPQPTYRKFYDQDSGMMLFLVPANYNIIGIPSHMMVPEPYANELFTQYMRESEGKLPEVDKFPSDWREAIIPQKGEKILKDPMQLEDNNAH